MKIRVGFLAGTVALALAGGYTLREVSSNKQSARQKQVASRVFDIIPEQIAAVTVERRGETVKLEKSAQGWRLVHPMESATDRETTSEMLRLIVASFVKRTVEESAGSLDRYGLGPLASRVTLLSATGAEKSVEVGIEAPTEEGVYIRRAGSGAVLVAGTEVRDLSLIDSQLLVERTLLPQALQTIRVEIRGRSGSVRLVKSAAGWDLREPFVFPADATRVGELLSAFAGFRSEPAGEPPPSAANAGLSPARLRAIFAGPSGKESSFTIGEPASKDRLWARRGEEGGAFLVDRKVEELLKQDPEEWCQRRPASIDRYRATRLKMRWESQAVALARDAQGWHDEKGRAVQEPLVLGLIAALCDTRSSRIEAAPSVQGRASLPFFAEIGEESGRSQTIEGWGPDPAGNWRVRLRGYRPALVMSEAYVRVLKERCQALTAQ